MSTLDKEELYSRSRTLFIDLLKLGLSLSTGIIGALAFIVFKEGITDFNQTQKTSYYVCLNAMIAAVALAIIGWLAQAMYYAAWATFFKTVEENRKDKWRYTRNVSIWGFAICFIVGIIAAAVFISSFIKVK